MIEIRNLRNCRPSETYDFYCDRRSPVGNPFIMYHNDQREQVCSNYYGYFHTKIIDTDSEFYYYVMKMMEAYKLYGILRLFCWCYPKQCHVATIKQYILENSI